MGSLRTSKARLVPGRVWAAGLVVALVCAVFTTSAAAAPRKLTGAWINPASPSSPAWHLNASSDRRTLKATWRGGAGHSALRGHATCTVDSTGKVYSGPMHITEQSVVVDGTITFTVKTSNKLSVSYQGNNGTGGTFTLVRKHAKHSHHATRH